jgi:hypothetical protein
MGSEDLFHKRKARTGAALQRQTHTRTKNKRYLIVCEGTKTEPNYFREMLVDLQVRPSVVRIAPNDGNSPDRIVAHALALYQDDAQCGDAYDAVYCVFDRDTHTTFDAAVQDTLRLNKKGKPLIAITSTPCFEVWLLLHFECSTQPFMPTGKKSAGDRVMSALKKKSGFGHYEKNQNGVYSRLKTRLSDALDHAAALRKQGVAMGSSNPATDIDQLVSVLLKLKLGKC